MASIYMHINANDIVLKVTHDSKRLIKYYRKLTIAYRKWHSSFGFGQKWETKTNDKFFDTIFICMVMYRYFYYPCHLKSPDDNCIGFPMKMQKENIATTMRRWNGKIDLSEVWNSFYLFAGILKNIFSWTWPMVKMMSFVWCQLYKKNVVDFLSCWFKWLLTVGINDNVHSQLA